MTGSVSEVPASFGDPPSRDAGPIQPDQDHYSCFCRPNRSRRRFLAVAGLALGLTGTNVGCTLLANLGHAVGADQIPPEFDGLEDSRIADRRTDRCQPLQRRQSRRGSWRDVSVKS